VAVPARPATLCLVLGQQTRQVCSLCAAVMKTVWRHARSRSRPDRRPASSIPSPWRLHRRAWPRRAL